MRKRRVAHFIESENPGGAETLLLEICSSLPEYGFSPIVLHFDDPYFIEQCHKLNIEQYTMPGRKYFKSWFKLWYFAFVLKNFIREKNIDIFHSHLFGPITGAALGARLAGIPHIGTLHDVYMIEEKHLRIRILQLAALVGTKLVTVSKTMENFYHDQAYFSPGAIRTIYNGVKIQNKYTTDTLSDLRSTLGLHPEDKVLINVGRLVKLKRHDVLIQAVSRLNTDGNIKLLIVGSGPELTKIQELVSSLGLGNTVILTGQRDDVSQLLGMSDIYVQCSDTEGLSMSIMEAMAASLPCIVTDVGGNHELVIDRENGWCVPPEDPDRLAEKIRILLEDKNRRKRMGENSLKLVDRNFSFETTMKNYISMYNL